MIKLVKYPIELFFFLIFFSLFYILPLKFARRLSSMLAPKVGKFTSTNKVILNNLKIAFPKESDEWISKINHDVWINFGKVVAEYAHLNELAKNNKITVVISPLINNICAKGRLLPARRTNASLSTNAPMHIIISKAPRKFFDIKV